MKNILFVIITVFLLLGCNSDDTDDFDCSSRLSCVGGEISLQFIDTETGADYILSNDLSFEDIVVVDGNGETDSNQVRVENVEGIDAVIVYLFNFNAGSTDFFYNISLENEFDFDFSFTQEIVNDGGCCPSYVTSDVNFDAVTVEVVENSGNRSYRILL